MNSDLLTLASYIILKKGQEVKRMIGYIKGTVEEIYEDHILLDNGGVGYRIFVSSRFIRGIGYGDDLKVYTYFSVKEDSMTLFGFADRNELETYRLLLSVSGVGPKAAMNVLSFMSADEFRFAVLTADATRIAKTPGLGKKTAQKILLELKDKFDYAEAIEETTGVSVSMESDAVSDAVEALMALGYSGSDSLKAVKKAAETAGTEDSGILLKNALKYIE